MDRNPRKRQRVQEDYDEEESGEEQVEDEEVTSKEIELKGHVMMVFNRDEDEIECISSLNMIVKGKWNMGNKAQEEDFIYKRTDAPLNEELLNELFFEDQTDRIALPDLTTTFEFNTNDQKQVLERFHSAQGHYQGYFKLNEQEMIEKFSIIFGKARSETTGYIKKSSYQLYGYGENDLGPFTLEGTLNMSPLDKIQEKDGLKTFKKIKFAEFTMNKTYQRMIIEDLVEEVRERRDLDRHQIREIGRKILI